MREYDVLILGGGPAGLSTALHLAQLAPGLIPRILVLEKAHYPRPKLCAGGLLADAEVNPLRRLGLDVGEVHTWTLPLRTSISWGKGWAFRSPVPISCVSSAVTSLIIGWRKKQGTGT